MSDLIDRQAFIENERKLYCEDCDRRKGAKNGKPNVICYEIGEAPCRACWLDDALTDLEDFPTASPWHRVEDGLPPKATWVLTVATDGNVKIFNIATVDAGGQWWTYSPQKILRELYGVRYWMPIEPPKEDA